MTERKKGWKKKKKEKVKTKERKKKKAKNIERKKDKKKERWGARGVMVIVLGNGHGDTSSNPRRDWLHFT